MAKQLPDDTVATIKLARSMKIKYELIASYYVINQGRIADVVKGRIGPNIPPALRLPPDFPQSA